MLKIKWPNPICLILAVIFQKLKNWMHRLVCLPAKIRIFLVIGLDGGADGTKEALSPSDFIGTDNGPGKRTGIQSFIDNDIVSIIAVPGVTDANVQLSLTAHCESLGSRFAVLDLPGQ